MPYAAKKVSLTKDAVGVFFNFDLDTSNVMVMSQKIPPKTFDIKFKLDVDGSAGPDSSGDIVGVLTKVKRGSKDLSLKLTKVVP
jgi:hypothetical protein